MIFRKFLLYPLVLAASAASFCSCDKDQVCDRQEDVSQTDSTGTQPGFVEPMHDGGLFEISLD
ncbi:MAG: hypothetical protein MJY84_04080 [Bacteroidales bacterium]|nr:hypothetical protein [Bacteroidales bacterium]